MGRPTHEQVRQIGDLALLISWDFEFTVPPPAIAGQFTSAALNVRCESADVPKLTDAVVEGNVRGHKIRQSGVPTYSDSITLTFLEDTKNTIRKFLKAWRDACWDPNTGKKKPQNEIEGEITLYQLDRDNNRIWFFKLHGAFWSDDEASAQLVGEGSDTVKPTVTVSYNYFTDGEAS